MHTRTYRNKFYSLTAAVSLAACTCALGLPSTAFAANQTPAASAPTLTPASTASSTPAPAPVPSSAPVVTTPHASAPASPETPAQPQDDSLTWTKDDFNISADGKIIGGRKNVYHPETNQTVNEYVDGLSAKGKEKLKKNHHVVIPEGIEVIHECAFTGHAKQVGNKQHEHIDGETYIEGVTLPQSLRIIEYGAFGWNKIKGTLTIPKNVISIHSAAFVANEIEKVVFEGVIDGKGKEHETDTKPYYLAGVGEKAFQGNKISEIVVKGNLGNYQLFPSNNPQKSDSVFDNQNPGPFTIEVGEEYKSPIKVTQESSGHAISVIEGFKENGNPVPIENSSYFQKNNEGKYVAIKPGTLQGQCLFYDVINGQFRVIGTSQFTYNILPKSKICTVTFVNETNQNYAKVQVKENKSINDKSVLNQVMPDNPSKMGYTFRGWSTDKTGKDKTKEFSASTSVTGDMTVYAIYTPAPAVLDAAPSLSVQDKTITEGDPLDLKSLVISATDKEDGDLKDAVQVKDNGGFDSAKAGTYTVTFVVTDKGGATTTKAATVTVKPKPKPEPAPAPTPYPLPVPVPEVPAPTPAPASVPEHKVPALEVPAPKAPAAPAEAPAPVARKHARMLPQTGDPMAISAVGELGMTAGIVVASLAATLRRKRR